MYTFYIMVTLFKPYHFHKKVGKKFRGEFGLNSPRKIFLVLSKKQKDHFFLLGLYIKYRSLYSYLQGKDLPF